MREPLALEVLDTDEVVEVVRELALLPGAAGHERARAQCLADLLTPRARAAGLEVTVDVFGGGRRANLLLGPRDGADLSFVGHLDSSLGDDPVQWRRLTGRGDVPRPVAVDGGALEGVGVGVALAPGVAAALAAIELHRHRVTTLGPTRAGTIGVLLAAGGTHRGEPPPPAPSLGATEGPAGAGVREAARLGRLPRAAINAKGGAPGPLHAEPGSLYLAVEIEDSWGPVLARPAHDDLTGAVARLREVLDGVAVWRRAYRRTHEPRDGLAVDVAVGAVDAGMPAKADLLPATARVHLHVVTAPGDDPDELADGLTDTLAPLLPGVKVGVRPYGALPGGRTDPAHPLVRAASAAWRAVLGPFEVRDWRGATDGALLRHLGVPTVRIGPPLSSDPTDPRRERVVLADLDRVAQIWARTACTYLDGRADP